MRRAHRLARALVACALFLVSATLAPYNRVVIQGGGDFPPAGFPDETDTGPFNAACATMCGSSGYGDLTLINGTLTLSTNGETRQCIDVAGRLVITADNVTVECARANSIVDAGQVIEVTGTDVTLSYVEADNHHPTTGEGNLGKCILANGSNLTMNWVMAHGCQDGIFGSNYTLNDSYVFDLYASLEGPGPEDDTHNDAIQIQSGGGVSIARSSIVNPYTQSGGALVQANNGDITSFSVVDSFLSGGSWTMNYDDRPAGDVLGPIVFTGNTIQTGNGLGGGYTYCPECGYGIDPVRADCHPSATPYTWSGNVETDSTPISNPCPGP